MTNTIGNLATELTDLVASDVIATLEDGAKLKEITAKVNELVEKVNSMKQTSKMRDRGPDSTREMTEDDARKVVLGELMEATHKEAAEQLGLSYGQVYSARKGFTFKGIYKELRDSMK